MICLTGRCDIKITTKGNDVTKGHVLNVDSPAKTLKNESGVAEPGLGSLRFFRLTGAPSPSLWTSLILLFLMPVARSKKKRATPQSDDSSHRNNQSSKVKRK